MKIKLILIVCMVLALVGCGVKVDVDKLDLPVISLYEYTDDQIELMKLLDTSYNKYIYNYENFDAYKYGYCYFESYDTLNGYEELGYVRSEITPKGSISFLVDPMDNMFEAKIGYSGYSLDESFFDSTRTNKHIESYYLMDVVTLEKDEIILGLIFVRSGESDSWSHSAYHGKLKDLMDEKMADEAYEKVLIMKCKFE